MSETRFFLHRVRQKQTRTFGFNQPRVGPSLAWRALYRSSLTITQLRYKILTRELCNQKNQLFGNQHRWRV